MARKKAMKAVRRKTAPKARRSTPRKERPAKTLALHYDEPQRGLDDVLIRGVLSNKSGSYSTEYAILFNSVLSTLTPGLRNLYYKNGISVGRELYRTLLSEKRYTWYEEGVADLVRFLERAGFNGITYNIYPDMIDIKFHNRDRTALGINTHVFESGIISGFLTAGKQQHVKVEEIKCSNNGSSFCHFVTTDKLPLYLEPSGNDTLERFTYSIKDRISSGDKGALQQNRFADEYYALSSSVFLNYDYIAHMQKIAYHLGTQVAPALKLTSLNGSSGRSLERLYSLLGLGILKVESAKPAKISIRFDRLKAKKEFVDISIAFLSGLLRHSMKNRSPVEPKVSRKGNSYMVYVTESSK
ncbi:MAG: hypothetical protein ACREBH_03655 [Candidatus Micrarchaeaceae archaeon]